MQPELKQTNNNSLSKTVVQVWPISWKGLEEFSTVRERQASTLHTKQSAAHSNELINSQLSSPPPSPSANSAACLAARSSSLKAQEENVRSWENEVRWGTESNAITRAGVIPMKVLRHQRKTLPQMTEGPCCPVYAHTTWKTPRETNQSIWRLQRVRRNAETDPFTSIWCPTSSLLTEREEKVVFANCPQNPRARRIFTFRTASWLLIFQGCQSRYQLLSHTLCHLSLNAMCKRLFNDSDQCRSGHLGGTVAHTLVGGAYWLGTHERPIDSLEWHIKWGVLQ